MCFRLLLRRKDHQTCITDSQTHPELGGPSRNFEMTLDPQKGGAVFVDQVFFVLCSFGAKELRVKHGV